MGNRLSTWPLDKQPETASVVIMRFVLHRFYQQAGRGRAGKSDSRSQTDTSNPATAEPPNYGIQRSLAMTAAERRVQPRAARPETVSGSSAQSKRCRNRRSSQSEPNTNAKPRLREYAQRARYAKIWTLRLGSSKCTCEKVHSGVVLGSSRPHHPMHKPGHA